MMISLRLARVGLGARGAVMVGARRGAATVSQAQKRQEDDEKQMASLERMASGDLPKDFDLKAQQLTILDLRFPTPLSKSAPGLQGKINWVRETVQDKFKSLWSFRKAYKVGLIPKPTLLERLTASSKHLTAHALAAYQTMNSSFARGDLKSLSRVCSEEQLKKLRERIKARPRDQLVVWQGEQGKEGVAKVMSFRTVDAWSSKQPQDHCAQVLVRFDTKQAVAVYGPKGKLLSGDPKKLVPVREYIIMEKKMWEDNDWTLRKSIDPPK
ncbi:Tim44 domain protein [Rhizoctonia solani AG-3 Rhs1AP]|uniref:Large ribosomal subunit protein mL45 n=3 Tax=Rhizoctonia solani AG-3 TaxID=1086053 RepID=A0A074S6Y1_9AGAM|nr:Tim44 domain protein [Rhizoctonia solani AG-3 Rhs1AP]KEP45787.1 Tim44 domain protein [Rhizoctonia solani 123E]